MGFGDRENRLGEVSRVNQCHARGHVQAARPADYDQTHLGPVVKGLNLTLGDTHDRIDIVLRGCIRTDDRLRAIDRGGDLLGIR